MLSHAAFIDLCEQELRLCAVAEGETLVVVSQGDERADYAAAFLAAAARLGANGFQIRLPEATLGIGGDVGVWTVGATPLSRNPAAVEALKRADIVVDVMFLLHSKELVEIQQSGTRILTCIEPVDILTRLFPTREIAGRVSRAVELLDAASTLRLTSGAGTDATFRLGAYKTFGQYGFADKPGQWDHWSSSGMAYTYALDDGVDGTVVVAPGDILLPFKTYVQTPIELTIEAGRIRQIQGGLDAELAARVHGELRRSRRLRPRAHRLGDEREREVDGPRDRSARPRDGVPRVLRQRAVLDRPEHADRRAQQHALPPRHPDAGMQPLPRRPPRGRRRRHRGRRAPSGCARRRLAACPT